MGTRLHVFVTVLATSVLTSGCIFGGGSDDKKRAAAAARARQESALAEQPVGAVRDDAVSRMLKPQASAVEWPKPDELRLTSQAPLSTRREQAVVQASPEAPEEAVVQPRISEPVPPQLGSATREAAPVEPAPSSAAVANKGLELADPADDATRTAPAAVAPVADAERRAPAQPANALVAGGELSSRIARRLRDNPRDLSAHLDHQLQRFLADEAVPDLNTLSPLPAEDRELLTALLDGLSNFRNGLRSDDNMLLSKKVRPLLELAARLRSQAELSIPTIALCRGVTGFGNYEPVDGRFVALQRNETIVYCEIANASSQQTADGVWESKLLQEAVLYTEDGQRVWSNPPIPTIDRVRNRRQDFFVAQKIVLPSNLTIDRYILKVTVMDQQVGRVAEATVPIQIVAALGPQLLGPLAVPAKGTDTAIDNGANASGTAPRGQQRAAAAAAPAPAGDARPASDRQTGPRPDVPRRPETLDGK
jgi:hypothetical protein